MVQNNGINSKISLESKTGPTNINEHSIGIELENKGHEFGYTNYSKKKGQSLRNGLRIIESLILLFFNK